MSIRDRFKNNEKQFMLNEEKSTTSKKQHKSIGFSRAEWKNSVDVEGEKYAAVQEEIRQQVIEDLKDTFIETPSILENEEVLRAEIKRAAIERLSNQQIQMGKREQNKVMDEICDLVLGYGAITPLIGDAEITEIMVNGPDQIYIEKAGKIMLTEYRFRNISQLMRVIQKIVAQIGRRVDESSPMVDARLPNGSRVNVILPPLSLKGPIVTIRKFSEKPFTIEDLVQNKTLTKRMGVFLKAAVEAKLNICISGGTGSGKTSTLNVLSGFIPENERIITIEDAAELKLRQEHVVSLETRSSNAEGVGEVCVSDLLRNALRMRPDRIVVGEVRGREAIDMLQAMNTGHKGSLTTGHANSARDILARLETMVLMGGAVLPIRAIRDQIASAIDLIIHQERMKDGSRRITHITEITGMEGDILTTQDLFVFRQEGIEENGSIHGKIKPTGLIPNFYDRFEEHGIILPKTLFTHSMDEEWSKGMDG